MCPIFATTLPPNELTKKTDTLIIYILSKLNVSEKQVMHELNYGGSSPSSNSLFINFAHYSKETSNIY